MELPNKIIDVLEQAEGKALATVVSNSAHVVPVSTLKVVDDKILLVNYFMGKTLENIKSNPKVSLACWKDLEGYQLKADVEYVTEGEIFDSIQAWVAEILPERVVKGVLILTPYEVYDISATIERPGEKILG
jgi:predicted pyridoxine 5'-phosphate oxidase superfamily flavin-nucleotide-binding protein